MSPRRARPLPRGDVYPELAEILDALEAELRRLGLWAHAPPPARALESQQPFCFDTLEFGEWLQWVFIPRTREVLAGERALPARSDIYPLAEEVCARQGAEAAGLLRLIARFDALINAPPPQRRAH